MEYFYDYDYWQLAQVLDFISWDSYPMWHRDKDETTLACYTAMYHDMMRSLKGGKPFVLMESTPSATNWQPTSKLKKPNVLFCRRWRTARIRCSTSSGVRAAVQLRSFMVRLSIMSVIWIRAWVVK